MKTSPLFAAAAFAVAGSLLTTPCKAVADEQLYGITFDNQLLKIDETTGAMSAVGPTGIVMNAMGLRTFNGELHALDQIHDQLVVLNPNDASVVRTVPVTGPDVFSEGDVAISPGGSGYYIDAPGNFFSLDFTTGVSTLIAANLPFNIEGMAFSPGGTLYAIDNKGDLYTVNPATGATNLLFDTGMDGGYGGLDFRSDGQMFGALGGTLFSIDLINNTAAQIGLDSGFNITGLAFLPALPEPSSAVIGAAAVSMLSLRRRKRPARVSDSDAG